MPDSRVFITHDSGLDFTRAAKYGELIKMTTGPVDVFRPHMIQKEVETQLELHKFNAATDFLLVAGSALPVGFAFSWLTLAADDGQHQDKVNVKLLIFDAKKTDYMVRTIQL